MRINEEQTNKTYLDKKFIVGAEGGRVQACPQYFQIQNANSTLRDGALTKHKRMSLIKTQN